MRMYEKLKNSVSHIYSDAEIILKAEIAEEIMELKHERNAVILGHNYMDAALFNSVPDFVGDSLELSRKAAETDADVIVFCGVRFMAETAKILSPEKTVLLPTDKGGCSLAEGITAAEILDLRQRFPGIPVVTYINTYADVKAETDICCTSGNAKAVVQSLPGNQVIFLPDQYLARNIAQELGKEIIFPTADQTAADFSNIEMIGWNGKCEVHDLFTVADIEAVRKQFPNVAVLAHPECPPEICQIADFAGSTSAMVKWVKDSNAPQYLLITECAMADNISAMMHDKEILRLCSHRCPHMGEVTLEQTLDALKFNREVITVPEDIRVRAKRSVDRMLEIGPSGVFNKTTRS
jgi:quinolinate synthase